MVHVRRVYDARDDHLGRPILVDRLWPRGVARENATWEIWCKAVAPSAALRRSYGHDPTKFAEFRTRYLEELSENDAFQTLKTLAAAQSICLLTATRDLTLSHATILAELLRQTATP